ncbi:diguanylate cyclase [Thermincola potens JR]|uniref:Diguanylate cyclase n=2 Tax=Thermincola TaxID=278993 RepID=D5X863_THEPJ|nr:diguanylate cyclase [Thermincola potens JR]
MKPLPENRSELFITRMRWLVVLGSPLLFYLSGLNTGLVLWGVVIGTALVNFYVHFYMLSQPISRNWSHLLSVLDTLFVSTMLFLRGQHQTDLHQLYYFLILVLGIRYGVKKYFGLVFVISIIYLAVSLTGAAFYRTGIDKVQLATQLIYFIAFGILASFILQREYEQQQEKEELIKELQAAYRQLSAYNAQVEEMAIKDPLTELYNYRYFVGRLREEIQWAQKYNKPLSLILLDIDYFKQFNDTYGHPAGDAALKKAAKIFQENIRDRDIVARYGGEEFFVLLPDTSVDEAYLCAERIRKAIEKTDIKVEEKKATAKITVSAGVAALSTGTRTVKDLLQVVDQALYQAKKLGRNKTQIYRPEGF